MVSGDKEDIVKDECRLCREDSEQAWHLARECLATYRQRMEIFRDQERRWTVDELLTFLNIPAIERVTTTRVDSVDGDPDWWRAQDGE